MLAIQAGKHTPPQVFCRKRLDLVEKTEDNICEGKESLERYETTGDSGEQAERSEQRGEWPANNGPTLSQRI